jgi:hypothetical protein
VDDQHKARVFVVAAVTAYLTAALASWLGVFAWLDRLPGRLPQAQGVEVAGSTSRTALLVVFAHYLWVQRPDLLWLLVKLIWITTEPLRALGTFIVPLRAIGVFPVG